MKKIQHLIEIPKGVKSISINQYVQDVIELAMYGKDMIAIFGCEVRGNLQSSNLELDEKCTGINPEKSRDCDKASETISGRGTLPTEEAVCGNKRHKHADVIHAFAEGAEIEWREDGLDAWNKIENPSFIEEVEYRVKPKTVTKWQWSYKYAGDEDWYISSYTETQEELDSRLEGSVYVSQRLDFTAKEFPVE